MTFSEKIIYHREKSYDAAATRRWCTSFEESYCSVWNRKCDSSSFNYEKIVICFKCFYRVSTNDEIISPNYEIVDSEYISLINTSVYGQEADKICVLMESVKGIFNRNEINGYNKDLIYQAITQEYLMALKWKTDF